jgi:hypothetical protein
MKKSVNRIKLVVIFFATSLFVAFVWIFTLQGWTKLFSAYEGLLLIPRKAGATQTDLLNESTNRRSPISDWALDKIINSSFNESTISEARELAESNDRWSCITANLILFKFRDNPEIRLEKMLAMVNINESEEYFFRIYSRIGPADNEFAMQILEAYQESPEGRFRLRVALLNLWRSPNIVQYFVLDPIQYGNKQDREMAANLMRPLQNAINPLAIIA